MKTEEVLDIIRTAIVNAKNNGIDKVALNDLDKMIQTLAEDAAESPEGVSAGEAAMATYKANLDALGNSLRYQHETRLEMLRATVTTSQSALRSSLLINAGAAVALLSFIGGIWGKGRYLYVIPGLSYSLSIFVWGVLAGALAAGCWRYIWFSSRLWGRVWSAQCANRSNISWGGDTCGPKEPLNNAP
ncbi:hypothetical protein NY667_24205 [Xanthomonas hortorum pv. hederae]|uniref:Uncharacterized protein n=1 Tax=Xanthomonas hortorum pv. hederae TaxID=453603 RepID=A0A9X4BWC7_9XANT|nr:hypothetical protein [Xanthomonas hortorum]MDC8640792.1 hypothetical protein [Xanthomonas hortorum pv. hederae]